MRWVIAILLLASFLGCRNEPADSSRADSSNVADIQPVSAAGITDQVVEVSCGQCQFGMKGSGCDLAIRVDGKSYFVDGSSIDDHGDAHAADGLCNCIRQAQVTGEIKDGRFVAEKLNVLPQQ